MAARKLQTEIDRTLKRVSEGVELFEEIHSKLMAANNATQKDKYETDLKSQIKKLQRLRDQIKTWLTSNDIKDKTQLLENRRLIEMQMERFKALEKEMKTKAFSKEGLQAATRLDPAARQKLEARHALEEFVDALSRQIETSEAEIETLQASAAAGGKKKSRAAAQAAASGGGGDKASELERLNERRQWHVGKLEAVMRMLENGRISVDQVNDLKEDVQYFVESNQDEEFQEDEAIYDELHLEEEEEAFATAQLAKEPSEDLDDMLSVSEVESARTPNKETIKATKAAHAPEDSVASSSQPPSPVVARKTPARKLTMESKFPEKPATAAPTPARTPSGSIGVSGQTPAQPTSRQASGTVTLPPIKYAAAAAAAVAATTPSSAPATAPSSAAPTAATPALSNTQPTPAPMYSSASHQLQHSPVATQSIPVEAQPSPALSHPSFGGAQVQPSPTPMRDQPKPLSDGLSPPLQRANAISPVSPRPAQHLPTVQEITQSSHDQHIPADQRSPQLLHDSSVSVPSFAESSAQAGQRAASRASDGQPQMPSHTPNALTDLMHNFENVKLKRADRANDLDGLNAALESGLASAPEPRDSERPRYYHPRNPYQTPPYYPQQPHPVLDEKNIYSRMDLDTLFFIFYYRTNTYEQWCAARELKRQSWRFHKQYLTWFQRLSQPLAITEEYEQGMYIYFDWENTWCRRRKTDFRFEYRWLCED